MRRAHRGLSARAMMLLAGLLVMLAATGAPPAWGAGTGAEMVISLNRAVEMALAHSDSVKKAGKDIERTEALRDYAAEALDFVPARPSGNLLLERAYTNLLTADLTWRMTKKTLTAQQDVVALDAARKYLDVVKAQDSLVTSRLAAETARRRLQNARAGFLVGTLAKTTLTAAEAEYNAALESVASAENGLDTAYTKLNLALGLRPEERPVLSDQEVPFVPLAVDDLDRAVNMVLESAPSVWLADQTVTMKELTKDILMYSDPSAYRPYDARMIEIQQAELDAAATRKSYDLLTRTLYLGVRGLERSYAASQEAVRVAEENLRVASVRMEVGLATPADVLAAQQALSEARSRALAISVEHAYMKLAFAKPWAYAGASATNR